MKSLFAGVIMAETKYKRTYLREWRKFRGLNQKVAVRRLEAFDNPGFARTTASRSRLENGLQPYSQPIMEALAVIYGTSVAMLIDTNPSTDRL